MPFRTDPASGPRFRDDPASVIEGSDPRWKNVAELNPPARSAGKSDARDDSAVAAFVREMPHDIGELSLEFVE